MNISQFSPAQLNRINKRLTAQRTEQANRAEIAALPAPMVTTYDERMALAHSLLDDAALMSEWAESAFHRPAFHGFGEQILENVSPWHPSMADLGQDPICASLAQVGIEEADERMYA